MRYHGVRGPDPRPQPLRGPRGPRVGDVGGERFMCMYIYIYTYIHISLSLSLYSGCAYENVLREIQSKNTILSWEPLYIYIYIYICVYMLYIYIYTHVYIYIYIYIHMFSWRGLSNRQAATAQMHLVKGGGISAITQTSLDLVNNHGFESLSGVMCFFHCVCFSMNGSVDASEVMRQFPCPVWWGRNIVECRNPLRSTSQW